MQGEEWIKQLKANLNSDIHFKEMLSGSSIAFNVPFLDALQKDFESTDKGYYKSHLYVELGQYYEQIRRYTDLFQRQKNIEILFFEDLTKDTNRFMNKVYDFLNLDPLQHHADEKENVSAMIKSDWLRQFNSKFRISKYIPKKLNTLLKKQLSTTKFPELSREDKFFLYSKYFKNDIENLESLLQADLSSWRYGEKQ